MSSQFDGTSVVSTTHDATVNDAATALELAKKEHKAVLVLKVLTGFVLIGAAVAVCLIVFFEGRSSEKEQFESDFGALGGKVIFTFESDVKQRIGIIDGFGMDITAYVNSNDNVSWPFVTPPNYAQRAGRTVELASLYSLWFLPKVATEEKQQWEAYARANQGWIAEGIAFDQGISVESVTSKPIPPVIFMLVNETTPVPQQTPGPYFPVWTAYPASNSTFTNLNPYGRKDRGFLFISAVLQTKKPSFPRSRDFYSDENREQSFIFNTIKKAYPDYNGDPYATSYYPVFDSLEKMKEDKEILGILMANWRWSTYFSDVVPEDTESLIIVLENDCGQVYTYQIDGRNCTFIGEGDLHDPKYDYLELGTDMKAVLDPEVNEKKEKIVGTCDYCIHVYPSQQFEQSYYTNKPMLASIALASIFLFTCSIFLLYDCMVERRQKIVMKSAQQSGQLVSSLFPEAVRDQLYKEQDQGKDKKSKEGNWEVKEDENVDKSAIATLYQETTIFFADLAGFTQWSSTRTPAEVFELLEALYGEFDRIAKSRRVFKVETIGDCYVAITGVPEPQPDHAVIMVKFAAQCMRRMRTKTAVLAEKLGEDTETLEMRVGLHSGAVTAGVLRGEKARFQLFGDSVNTASRMESNGIKGRIQCSQSTADALIAAGKAEWVTPRDEQITAKGKGKMQTYWVNVRSDAKSLGTSSANGGSESNPDELETGVQFNHRTDIGEQSSTTAKTSGASSAYDGTDSNSVELKSCLKLDYRTEIGEQLLAVVEKNV